MMYYALIDAGPTNEPLIPVAEMITNDQRSLNVSHFLNCVVSNFKKVTDKELKPWKLETDFSWCLVHAGCLLFNKMDILQYLDECWKYIRGPYKSFQHTILHLCSAHMIHLVARKTKAVTNKNLQQFILYVSARMQNASEISELEAIFFDFSVVLLSTTQNAEFKRSLDNLTNQIKGVKDNTDRVAEATVSYSEQDIKSSAETGPLYAKSPFYNIFQSLRMDAHEMVKTKSSSEGDPNPYYSPETVDMLMKYAMSYTPLWSGLIFKEHNITRDTNCHC